MVLTFGPVFSSVSPFLPVSSIFFMFSPFFIKLILQIYHQEFGTDCLGLVIFCLVFQYSTKQQPCWIVGKWQLRHLFLSRFDLFPVPAVSRLVWRDLGM